jgi:hypothetical protein
MKLPMDVEVEMYLTARVTLTQEIVDGIADQYPEAWRQYEDDPEELARMVLYASTNPCFTSSNEHFEDWWDGVGNMQGLIHERELS